MLKFRMLAVAGVMAASMVTLGAGTALAGDTPTPEPTVTVNPVPAPRTCDVRVRTFTPPGAPDQSLPGDQPSVDQGLPSHVRPTVTPTVNPQRRCSPEQFLVQLTALGNTVVQNRVIASGPVAGTGSDDLAVSTNIFDRFRLPGLLRRVNVDHTGISFPSINLPLCVASVNQLGVWRFNGGPAGSVFRNAIGNGRFLLTGQWVFPTIRGVCSLSLIRGNPLLQNRIQPRYTNIQVWATGFARR